MTEVFRDFLQSLHGNAGIEAYNWSTTASLHILSNSFTYHPFIRRNTVWVSKESVLKYATTNKLLHILFQRKSPLTPNMKTETQKEITQQVFAICGRWCVLCDTHSCVILYRHTWWINGYRVIFTWLTNLLKKITEYHTNLHASHVWYILPWSFSKLSKAGRGR